MKQEILKLSEDVITKYLKEVNGGNADAYLVQDTQTIMNLVSKEEKQAQDATFKKDELANEKRKIELEEKKLEFEKKKEDNSRKETEDRIKLDKEKLDLEKDRISAENDRIEIEKAKIEVEKAKIEANKEAEKARNDLEKSKIEAEKEMERLRIETSSTLEEKKLEVEKAKIELELKQLEVTSKQESNKSRNGLIVGIAGAAATVLTIGGSIIVQKLKDKHEMEREVMQQNALSDRVSEIIKSERNEDRIFTGFSKIELQNNIK